MLTIIRVVSVVCLLASTVLLQVSQATRSTTGSRKSLGYAELAKGMSHYPYWKITRMMPDIFGIKQTNGPGSVISGKRAESIPIIYVSGTHYEVGYNIGRTFGQMIRDFVFTYEPLHKDLLPRYYTQEGRDIYEESYTLTEEYFPQYISELRGTADGAGVKFEELFLMALDDTLVMNTDAPLEFKGYPTGCTSLMVNQSQEQLLGHTEDALSETIDNYYIIAAHIMPGEDEKTSKKFQAREEKFKALTYAGHLPGYASGYNHHGLLFSINTIFIDKAKRGRIPREFLTRALLSAEADVNAVLRVLINYGGGTADGFNVNLAFWNVPEGQARVFHTIEVAPSKNGEPKSLVAVTDFKKGSVSLHTNKLLKLKYPEATNHPGYESSNVREKRYKNLTSRKPIRTVEDLLTVLGDRKDYEYPIFNDRPGARVRTINLGVFDLKRKTWTMWTRNPKDSNALIQLPLGFMDMISPTPRISSTDSFHNYYDNGSTSKSKQVA